MIKPKKPRALEALVFSSFPVEPVITAAMAGYMADLDRGELEDILERPWPDVIEATSYAGDIFHFSPEGFAYYLPAILVALLRDPECNASFLLPWALPPHLPTIFSNKMLSEKQCDACLQSLEYIRRFAPEDRKDYKYLLQAFSSHIETVQTSND